MGYRIDYYDRPKITLQKNKSTWWRIPLATMGFFAVFVVCVEHLWPDGKSFLHSVLLSGQEAAFSRMVDSLRSGEGIGEALEAFCREVLANAGIAG